MNFDFLATFPKARKWTYFAQWVVNGITGITGIVLTSLGLTPAWFLITTSVLNFVWTYVGLQAGANTPGNTPPPQYEGRHMKNEYGRSVLAALGLALIVLAVLLAVLNVLSVVSISWVALVVVLVIGLALVWVDRGAGNRVL